MLTKLPYSPKTGLAVSGWIRRQHNGSYPLPLKGITCNYLKIVCEKWKPRESDCMTLSNCDEGSTITYTCPIRDHSIRDGELFVGFQIAYGSILTSTEGAQHSWAITINNIQSYMSIGICNPESIYYGMDISKGTSVQDAFELSGNIFTNRLKKYESVYGSHLDHQSPRLVSGDHVVIRLEGNNMNLYVIHSKIKFQT